MVIYVNFCRFSGSKLKHGVQKCTSAIVCHVVMSKVYKPSAGTAELAVTTDIHDWQ